MTAGHGGKEGPIERPEPEEGPDSADGGSGEAVARARDDALNLLSHRARTVDEMRRRLRRKGHVDIAVEEVVEGLREIGYLDDRDFARRFLEERLDRRPRGPFALVQELRQRGVDRSLAQDMVRRVMEERGVKETDVALDAAERWLDRQAATALSSLAEGGPEAGAARRRFYAYLERRGFRRATVRRVVEEVVERLRSG